MRITFFIGGMRRGGAERVISILANHYAKKGWNVDIVKLLYSEVEYELDTRIRVVDMVHTGSYIKGLSKWIKQIRKYVVQTEKPDRIVSFIGRINVLVSLSLLGSRIPIIASERNDPRQDGRGKFMLWLCNQCYKHISAVVFQTRYQRNCFSKSLEKNSYIIPNPINVLCEKKEPKGCRIVTAGRLIQQKNQKMLVDAFSIVQTNRSDASLEIYGSGILKDALQKQIDDLGLSNSVLLSGNVPDLHERIADASVFVMTSEFEGQSNALLEAMMLGLPCITTDYPGVTEIIENGKNGLLVPRNDSVALAQAIELMLTNDNLRERLIENGYSTAEHYKHGNVLKMWEQAIMERF